MNKKTGRSRSEARPAGLIQCVGGSAFDHLACDRAGLGFAAGSLLSIAAAGGALCSTLCSAISGGSGRAGGVLS